MLIVATVYLPSPTSRTSGTIAQPASIASIQEYFYRLEFHTLAEGYHSLYKLSATLSPLLVNESDKLRLRSEEKKTSAAYQNQSSQAVANIEEKGTVLSRSNLISLCLKFHGIFFW